MLSECKEDRMAFGLRKRGGFQIAHPPFKDREDGEDAYFNSLRQATLAVDKLLIESLVTELLIPSMT
jgi:hypothetical protein